MKVDSASKQLLMASNIADAALLDNCHKICLRQELQLVGDQHPGSTRQQSTDALLKQVPAHMGVHSTEGVIQ